MPVRFVYNKTPSLPLPSSHVSPHPLFQKSNFRLTENLEEKQVSEAIQEADALAAEAKYEEALARIGTALDTYPKSEALLQKDPQQEKAC